METISLKDYCLQNNIKSIGSVYASKENNYPMVALTKSDGEVEHLMLTKSAGEEWDFGTHPKIFAKDAFVVTFEHETLGETVSRISTGTTASVENLFDLEVA